MYISTDITLSGCQMTMEPLGSNPFKTKFPGLPSANFIYCQFTKHAIAGIILYTLLLYYELSLVKYAHFLCCFGKKRGSGHR